MIHPPFQAIIFDLDGTLIDTISDLAHTVNLLLKKRNLPLHTPDAYRIKVGDGIRILIQRSLPKDLASVETIVNAMLEDFDHEYALHWKDQTKPYPGILDLLKQLSLTSIKKAVLSNKPQYFTELCVHHFFPSGNFDMIRGAQSGIPPKPDPFSACAIASQWSISEKDILYVGDTAIDMQTALNAGMVAVGVEWGFRDRKELLEHGAQIILQHPEELMSLLSIVE